MIEIQEIRIPCGAGREALEKKLRRLLRLGRDEPFTWRIARHGIDARKRPQLMDVYTVEVSLRGKSAEQERKRAERAGEKQIRWKEPVRYSFPSPAPDAPVLRHRPVVIGTGPAGLFCALKLAEQGYRPLVLERGAEMTERTERVERFWRTGELDPSANIQFGEGGAGTYSDGKLTTNVKDRFGRNAEVLRIFITAGAPEEIAYESHPHIGTDRLRDVVRAIRNEIIRLGGEVRFRTRMTDLIIRDGALTGILAQPSDGGAPCRLETEVCVLAPGHSARDTIRMLYGRQADITRKDFAVGLRVSHPQKMIDERAYGIGAPEERARLGLPAASYKLVTRAASGRGVVSFCMCPGGYIVDASSEPGGLAVNGMSDYARDSARANSAIVMTVGAETVGGDGPLDGLHFQERLERRAASLAAGRIPVERFTEFERVFRDPFSADTEVRPLTAEETEALCLKGRSARAPLHALLPETLTADFIEGMHTFERKIPGFAGPEALVAGLESRTSSPVRITRDESFQSNIRGLYPCGEGAGYAGGIMSAAIDGIRTAEAVARRYRPDAGTDEANGPQ